MCQGVWIGVAVNQSLLQTEKRNNLIHNEIKKFYNQFEFNYRCRNSKMGNNPFMG
jgi:hypothetical protein